MRGAGAAARLAIAMGRRKELTRNSKRMAHSNVPFALHWPQSTVS
jgi:hypothetical protein